MLLISLLTLFVMSCDSDRNATSHLIPDYIDLGKLLSNTSEFLSCNTAVYELDWTAFQKHLPQHNQHQWSLGPIDKSILDGMSIKSKTLLGGMGCGDFQGRYMDALESAITLEGNPYIFLQNDALFLLADKQHEWLFVIYVE